MPKTISRAAVLGSLHPKVLRHEDREFHEHEIQEKGFAWEQNQKKHGKSIGYPRKGYQKMLPETPPGQTELVSENQQDIWGRTPDNPVPLPSGMSSSDVLQARVSGVMPRLPKSTGVSPGSSLHSDVSQDRIEGLQ